MSTKPAAARRAREKRERRDAILEAAAQVFGEKGAAHATMDEVAEAARVSKGTLYLYFESKDDLFLALTHAPLEAVVARFAVMLEDTRIDGLTLLSRLIEAHAAVLEEHSAQFRLAMGSLCGGFSPSPAAPSLGAYTERVQAVRRAYITALERGMKDGSMRSDLDPRRVAGGLWAGVFGATFLRMNAPRLAVRLPEEDRADLEALVPITAELLLRAVASPTRAEEPR